MKYLRTITILLILLTAVSASGQTEIEFQHKSLLNILNKHGIQSFEEIKEVQLTDINNQDLRGKYFQITHDIKDQLRYIYIGRVNSCRAGGCSIAGESSPDLDFEYFDYFILFDSNKTVKQVKVFNYQATHGQEITSKGWLRQFVGYNTQDPLLVDKNVDSISGATISVYAITSDVEIKTEILQKLAD